MNKKLLFFFITAFLFTATSNLKAQALYSDTTIDPSGEIISLPSGYVLEDDVQLDPSVLGSYDTINVTMVKVAIYVTPKTPGSTVSLYYSLVSDTSTSPGTAPAVPVLASTLTLPAGGTAGVAEIVSFGDSVHTLFKVPKLVNDPYVGYQTFFTGLEFSRGLNANGTGCGWFLIDPTEENADSVWQYTTTGTFEGATSLTDAGISFYSSFYTQVFGTLISTFPVKFLNFDGILQNNEAVLNWSTGSEINNKGFEVERSSDGQTFASIGFVQGNGTTSTKSNYSFSDPKLVSGNNYYRLKQEDLDGKFNYSSVINLQFSKLDWSVLGNPSNNEWLQLQLDKQHNVSVEIVSLSGTVLQTINKGTLTQGTYSIPLDLSHAASGMYIVKLMVDGQSSSKTIVK